MPYGALWTPISIPFWSDFNYPRRERNSSKRRISIPFWSDFNPDLLDMHWKKLAEFQSHFGLILTHIRGGNPGILAEFQSHFGLILTTIHDLQNQGGGE